eukprot:8940281-Pyramimonas_sp.AAC.1
MLVQRAGLKQVFGTATPQAEHRGTTGNPAGALAVRLLAHEAKTDIYAWKKYQWAMDFLWAGAKYEAKEKRSG